MLFKINNSYQLDVKSRGRNKVKSWGGRVINIKQSDLVHVPNPFEVLTVGLSYVLFKNRLCGSKPSAFTRNGKTLYVIQYRQVNVNIHLRSKIDVLFWQREILFSH